MLSKAIATWFGCGYVPAGPGTAGSIAALAIAWAIERWFGWTPLAFGALALIFTPIGVWAAGRCAASVGAKDPGIVVIDEVLGQWITLAGAASLGWKSSLAAFLLFRAFDILKPPPVRQLESLKGGLGIVADDLMAGLYGALVLFAARWLTLL